MDLDCKSIDWFLYDRDNRRDIVKSFWNIVDSQLHVSETVIHT